MTTPAPVRVSDLLRTAITDLGAPAERWLSTLPEHIARIADAWQLDLDEQLDHIGFCSVVYPATTTSGEDVMLKATVPHDDAAGEGWAMRRWAGDGAARLLRASDDGFTLLLERCRPGLDLWTLPIDDQIDVATLLLPRLWVDPGPDPRVTDLETATRKWVRRMRHRPDTHDLPADVLHDAADWAEQLLGSPQPRVLLHGDLNPGNVLAATREPWLAIDPKPFVGEPAFDLAQLLLNWIHADDGPRETRVQRMVGRTSRMAGLLDLDVDRALRWAAVKAIGWDGTRDEATVLHAAARAVTGGATAG